MLGMNNRGKRKRFNDDDPHMSLGDRFYRNGPDSPLAPLGEELPVEVLTPPPLPLQNSGDTDYVDHVERVEALERYVHEAEKAIATAMAQVNSKQKRIELLEAQLSAGPSAHEPTTINVDDGQHDEALNALENYVVEAERVLTSSRETAQAQERRIRELEAELENRRQAEERLRHEQERSLDDQRRHYESQLNEQYAKAEELQQQRQELDHRRQELESSLELSQQQLGTRFQELEELRHRSQEVQHQLPLLQRQLEELQRDHLRAQEECEELRCQLAESNAALAQAHALASAKDEQLQSLEADLSKCRDQSSTSLRQLDQVKQLQQRLEHLLTNHSG